MSDSASRPPVLAIVVATDGAETLPEALAALEAQDYPDLTVVGVDNGSSDASRSLLLEHLGRDHVLVADRDLGFGGAVGMALDAEVSRGAPYVLLVHDDLALRPDATSKLVAALEGDEDRAVVGCKLVEWERPEQLQAVGMSVDLTGRADPGVDPDEIDQGQRDHEGPTQYVSTAGMMVRRDRFEQLGRFDHRYHLFRDDLDLCWRAWLAGWTVEVVPEAVGRHEASAATYRRLGQTAFLGPRYFAERNTLASLLKNYGIGRLLYVVPLFLVVGVAKVLGFIATRRLGDAWQTVRAWAWNLLHLRETWRLRHRAQAARVRSDAELQPLFAQVTARLRAYGEALGALISGGSDEIALMEEDTGPPTPEPTLGERITTTIRTSPVGVAAVVLLLLGAVVAFPLMGRTMLAGGDLALWPDGVWSVLRGYAAPWDVGDLPAVVDVTPGQALLTLPSVLAGGVAWAAPRVLLLAIVPIAWASALRAGRLVTSHRLPRVAGATVYALSPPMIAALRTGRISTGVAAAVLPLLVIAATRAVQPGVARERAWRAAAAASLAAATVVAFEPGTALLVLVAATVALLGVVTLGGADTGERLLRLGLGLGGAVLLLAPWWPALRAAWRISESPTSVTMARLLLLTPDLPGFPHVLVGVGLAVAALLGVALSAGRAGVAAGLATVYAAAVGTAWAGLQLADPAVVWPGAPLAVAVMAAAGLLAIAFDSAEETLAEHAFGWRQLAALGAGVLVVVGVATAALGIIDEPWAGYREGPRRLPAFLASEVAVEGVGPFRVLVVSEQGADVTWTVTDADGPTMASWGHRMDDDVVQRLATLVDELALGRDPAVAARLGHLGVRYVVVPAEAADSELGDRLQRQLDLLGQPVAEGLVFRVEEWLPRWTVVDDEAEQALAAGRPLPVGSEAVPLSQHDGRAGRLVLADLVGERQPWQVTVDGEVVAAERSGAVVTWELPAGEVALRRTGTRGRLVLVTVQGLLAALALSLSLRAPGFAREESGS